MVSDNYGVLLIIMLVAVVIVVVFSWNCEGVNLTQFATLVNQEPLQWGTLFLSPRGFWPILTIVEPLWPAKEIVMPKCPLEPLRLTASKE